MAFRPRDVIEAMIASHCVMFHELIVDSAGDTLRCPDAAARRPARSVIVAMDKAFGNNLARLEGHRARRAEVAPVAGPEVGRTETDIADRIRRHRGPSFERPVPVAAPRTPAGSGSEETVAAVASDLACPEEIDRSVIEAMGIDPTRFAAITDVRPLGEGGVTGARASDPGFGGPETGSRSQPPSHAFAGNRQARRLAARNGHVTNAAARG